MMCKICTVLLVLLNPYYFMSKFQLKFLTKTTILEVCSKSVHWSMFSLANQIEVPDWFAI